MDEALATKADSLQGTLGRVSIRSLWSMGKAMPVGLKGQTTTQDDQVSSSQRGDFLG
jgi:hypothetical protein